LNLYQSQPFVKWHLPIISKRFLICKNQWYTFSFSVLLNQSLIIKL